MIYMNLYHYHKLRTANLIMMNSSSNFGVVDSDLNFLGIIFGTDIFLTATKLHDNGNKLKNVSARLVDRLVIDTYIIVN